MRNERFFKNEDNASIGRSGNSDVDITIDIDTTGIAYAMLCSLYATDRLNRTQFKKAVDEFDSLMRKKGKLNHHNSYGLSTPKLYSVPKENNNQSEQWV
jgi:hypothetical protein